MNLNVSVDAASKGGKGMPGTRPLRRRYRGRQRWTPCLGFAVLLAASAGCVSDRIDRQSPVATYQETLAARGPQERIDSEGQDTANPLGLLKPAPSDANTPANLEIAVDPNTGRKIATLTVEQAIFKALANSPEIGVVSFDPAIAKQEITKAAADFDPTFFSRANYEDEDNPENSMFAPGQSETQLFESGLKQRTVTGAEWSASYALTRAWDDLVGRTLPTRYEPILAFQVRQPLLRDAGLEVNLAGLDIARLEHEVALLGFRRKAEEVSAAVVRAYWQLWQARRNLDTQRQLVTRTLETMDKVEGRRAIDATGVQIQQAKSYAKSRQAVLLRSEKQLQDIQDALMRLMADSQANVTSEVEIIAVTAPGTDEEDVQRPIGVEVALSRAMESNPIVQQARTAVEVADINLRVAKNQRMPRLDLVTSARTQGLSRDRAEANSQLGAGADYASYAVGLTFEFPLGDRQRHAELVKRRLERRKAVSVLQNVADQVAVQVKERIRKVQTNRDEIGIQREAAVAAGAHLQALEDSEMLRERLTAEFLLVKLQAQEILAQAQRAENNAIAEFNISLVELAQATGTVLDLHMIQTSLSTIARPSELLDKEDRHTDG